MINCILLRLCSEFEGLNSEFQWLFNEFHRGTS